MTKNIKRSPTFFFKIYDFMLSELNLKGRELLVYAYIFNQIELNNRCEISSKEIANSLKKTRNNILADIKKLKEKNLISYSNRSYGTINKYSLILDEKVISEQDILKQYIISKQDNFLSRNKIGGYLETRYEGISKQDTIKNIKEYKKEYKDTDLLSETISHIDNDNLSNNYIGDDSDSTELADDELPF